MKNLIQSNKFKLILILILILVIILLYMIMNIKEDKLLTKLNGLKSNEKTITSYLEIPNTNISYPIIDRKKYEKEKEFNVLEDEYLFTYTDDKNLLTKKNNKFNEIILGHNRKNLAKLPKKLDPTDKIFGQLLSFNYLEFVKENQYIYYTTDKTYKYKIFSVALLDENFNKTKNNMNDNEKEEYIEMLKNYSKFDFGTKVNKNDKIISLSTCTRMLGNRTDIVFVVSAVMVDDNNLSSVTDNIDYIRVEEQK